MNQVCVPCTIIPCGLHLNPTGLWNGTQIPCKKSHNDDDLGKHNDSGFLLIEDNEIRGMRFSDGIQENQALEIKLKDFASTNLHSCTCNIDTLLLSVVYTEESWNVLRVYDEC